MSLDNVTFASSRTITASGTLGSTTVYVHFKPTTGGAKTGNVTLSSTGAADKTVAVSGTGVGPSATLSGTISETTMNPGSVTINLTADTYSATLTAANFTLNNAPAGTSIFSVARFNDTQAIVTLAYTGGDFDANVTNFNISMAASEVVSGTPLTTNNITITAVIESFTSAGTLAMSATQCINTTGDNSFSFTGTNLKAGDITIGALTGFTYSATNGGTYTPTLTIPNAAAGNLASTTVYVRFTPTLVQSYGGNIAITGGGATFNKAVTGTGVNTNVALAATPTSGSVTSTAAALSGNITTLGCSPVTERGIYYSTSSTFPDGTGTKLFETSAGFPTGGIFTQNPTGLTPATTYYFKSFAVNSLGTVYSANRGNFTTACVTPGNVTSLVATTTVSSQVGLTWANSSCSDEAIIVAKLGSAVTATPSGDGTAYTAGAFSAGTQIATGEYVVYKGSGTSATVTGLTNGSVYHFTVFTRKGTNWSAGTATSATPVIVYCNATYGGGGPNDYVTNVTLGALTQVTGSQVASPYYINYTTTQTVVPDLTKGSYYNVTLTLGNDSNQYSAIWLDFNNNGNFEASEYFSLGTNAGALGTAIIPVLIPETAVLGQIRMRVRGGDDDVAPTAAQGCGASGSSWGQTQDYKVNILTNEVPIVTTTAATPFSYYGGTSGGNITNGGTSAVTVRGVVYATTAMPTISNAHTEDGGGTGSYSSTMEGLLDNTLYYVRAYATNTSGTGYGAQVTFTTGSISAPVATAATYLDDSDTGFVANWDAVGSEQDYKLDISTSPAFSGETPANVTEYFETGLPTSGYQDGPYPFGTGEWILNNGLRSSGAGNRYSGTYALQMQGGTASSATSPSYNKVTTVTFYAKATGGSTFTVSKIVGGVTTLVGSYTLTSSFAQYTATVNETSSDVKIIFLNTGGNNAFLDETVINYAGVVPSFIPGYNGADVTGTSKDVTGLTAGTEYYYRVRAVGANSTSGNSNTITAVAKVSNVWLDGAWTAGHVPTALEKAIILSDYNTAENDELTAGYLSVLDGILTVSEGTTVTIANEVVVDNILVDGEIVGAQMIIENNANLMQDADVDNSGYISVIKDSAPIFRLDYAMWSSPVTGETLAGFSPNTLSNRFYQYNPVSDAYTPKPGSTPFAEGSSYLIRVDNTHDAYDVDTNFVGTPWIGTFTGTPNNGNVTVDVTNPGFNAVGNPYPSPINIEAFYLANAGSIAIDAPLFFWRKKNGEASSSYASLTLEGYTANGQVDPAHPEVHYGDASNGQFANANESDTWVLNPGQGFIVKTTGDIVFNNDMRQDVNNGQLFRTAQDASSKSRLWLNINAANGSFHQAMIGYSENGTLGLDYARDGRAMTDGEVALYSLVDETKLGIQARPSFEATDEVPMGYKATTAGTYTVTIDHVDGVFAEGQQIYLRDNLLGLTHNLSEGGYSFATEEGTVAGRFDVVYAQALGTNNPVLDPNSVIVYKDGSSIRINSGIVDMTTVSVYDMRGRLLYTGNGINATETAINGLQAEKQVLIVNISTLKGEVSKKIIF